MTMSTPGQRTGCAENVDRTRAWARHDFDTRATQNLEKRRQPLSDAIRSLTCDDGEFRNKTTSDEDTPGADS
jgi:hypothetical protein